MLTEHFVASISAPTKPNTGVTKDAGIFFYEYQPLAAQRHVFKKSASNPHGLAVSSSHIFAAQTEKAIVHVYSREKGNQEAIVPFPERIHSIALASNDTVLLLGTESGRILAWEIFSGRMVSTSTSHLQPVTSIAVAPTSNFFLSGSPDSMIHVWNLPSILSFSPDSSRSPIHTLSTHRGSITSLICGHSSSTLNLAISISEDKSAIVWDYHNGQSLRTYLLPEVPTAITLDPVDRGFYVAYEDGSMQTIDFYDESQHATASDILRDGSQSHRPLQPSPKTRYNAESQKLGGAHSLGLSWDSTTLISGHASGKVASWDIASRNYVSTLTSLPGPVTNLQFLPPTGFPNSTEPNFKISTVVKPKQDPGLAGATTGLVPSNYNLNMQFTRQLSVPSISATEKSAVGKTKFEEALVHPSFPLSMLEESLAELESWNVQPKSKVAPAADFLALDAVDNAVQGSGNEEEMQELKNQLASLQRIQKATFQQLSEVREEKEWFEKKEKKRVARKQLRHMQTEGPVNGNAGKNVEMNSDGSSATESEESDDTNERSEDEEEHNGAESK